MQTFIRHVIVAIAITTVSGCGSDSNSQKELALGGIELGGVFRLNEVHDVRSLYPLEITESTGYRIASQVYQGLVKFDQRTLEIEPALAERWESNTDATEWTFFLRKGVKFHDDPCFPEGKGREMTANDVKWCTEQLCAPTAANQMFWLIDGRLKGAQEFYNAGATGSISGMEVLDDYTIKFKLEYPMSGLLQILAHNAFFVYPQEAFNHYGKGMSTHAVGTGPFKLELFKPGEVCVLRKNQNYYGHDMHGNQLPYLDAIQISFVKDKKSELLMFKNKELDMIFTFPIEMYADVLTSLNDATMGRNQDFEPQVTPSMSIHYCALQHQSNVFKDGRVRRAFNMAVDKESIVNHTLQGEGSPGIYGVIPPAFTKYDQSKVNRTEYNPEMARTLFAQAGYPDGKGFPEITMQLSSGGTNYELVAQVLVSMLHENLGVNIKLQVLPIAQLLDNAETGKATMWYDGWLADYPDPENFLRLFVSNESDTVQRAYLNSVRYSNPLYDSLYYDAIRETDETQRYEIYRSMDQMLIHDAVIIPIYYEEFTRLIPARVKNFPQNSIEHRDFSEVWISTLDEPEA
ncbi:MAG: ABC transporter substrate-binding protein [Flavobacteriales bacterium]